jgi:hypothetical protein
MLYGLGTGTRRDYTAGHTVKGFIIIIIIIIIITTAIEFSLGGASSYTSTDKTKKNKYT